jgi:hypothetical protein
LGFTRSTFFAPSGLFSHTKLNRFFLLFSLTVIGCFSPSLSLAQCVPTGATLTYLDDDAAYFYVNGALISSCVSTAGSGGAVSCWSTPTTYVFSPADLATLVQGQNVLGVVQQDLFYNYAGVAWDLTINFSCCPTVEITSNGANTDYLMAGDSGSPSVPSGWSTVGFNDSAWISPTNVYSTPPSGYGVVFTSNLLPVPWTGPVSLAGAHQEYLFRQTFNIASVGSCATITPTPALSISKSILGPSAGVTAGENVTYVVSTCNTGGPLNGPVTVSEGLYYTSSGGSFGENGLYYKNWNNGLPASGIWTNPPAGPNFYGDYTNFYWVYPEGLPGYGYCDSVTILCLSYYFSLTSGPCSVLNNAVLTRAAAGPVTSNTVSFTTNAVCGSVTPTDTSTNTPTNTPTNSATNTPTNSATASQTNTNTVTPTDTHTNTPTPSDTPTPSNTATPSNTPTNTATYTWTKTPTNTNTVTPTATATNTVTPTNTPTNSNTITPTATLTDTPTNTPIITNTFTNSPTNSPTNTVTKTPTNTQTNTNTPTLTDTWTSTSTPTNSNTPTLTLSPTNTATPSSTNTLTDTPTPSNTYTATDTFTVTRTNTSTDTPSSTSTDTLTPTNSATPTNTNTPTATPVPFGIAHVGKTASNTSPQSNDGEAYIITINVPASGVSNLSLSDTLPAGLTYVSATSPIAPPGILSVLPIPTPAPATGAGTLLVWNFPFVPTGNWAVTVNASVHDFTPAGTVIDNQAALYYTGASLVQTADAPVTVTGNYTVRVNVYNEAGELVKTLLITKYSEPVQNASLEPTNTLLSINDKIDIVFNGVVIGTWNGTNNSGNEVANGKYYIKIDNLDPLGAVESQTLQAMVSRHLAQVTVNIYNEAGEVIRQLYESTADFQSLSSGVTLSATTLSPGYTGSPASSLTLTLSGGTVLAWDGRNGDGNFVTNGEYFIEIQTNDGQGGTSTVTKAVMVFSNGLNPAGGSVVVYPNPWSAASGRKQVNFFLGTPNMTLRVNIYSLAGELVARTSGLPGSSTAVWDFSDQKVASGLYIAVVAIQNSAGGSVRQMRKIAVIQ